MTGTHRSQLRLILLSTQDLFVARLFQFISLACALMTPTLLVALLVHGQGLAITPFFFLALLHATAMILIGKWSRFIAEDLKNGTPTPFRTLVNRTRHKALQRDSGDFETFWIPFSLLISLLLPAISLATLGRYTPLLLMILTPLWPFLSLMAITTKRVKAELLAAKSSSNQVTGVKRRSPSFWQTDLTRPLSVLSPQKSDKTVAATARTNPAGFQWTENNRQALMMDILSGQLNFEDAQKRYGLQAEDLKAWMKDFLEQNQAPHQTDPENENGPSVPT